MDVADLFYLLYKNLVTIHFNPISKINHHVREVRPRVHG